MSFIQQRTDVSKWLIHFVRDRDPENDFPGDEDEYERLVGNRLEPDAEAYAVLKTIIDIGALLPGYSYRGGKTTIYGGKPAVCFTEAPIYDFVKYVSERNQANRCSHYGVCCLKSELFSAGGRPVIYGLSGGVPKLVEDSETVRVIDPAVLPLAEQFRYVAYDPMRAKPLDWTHEREWRWTATLEGQHEIWYDGPVGVGPYAGFPLFRPREDGGYLSRLGILVRTHDEAREISELILGYVDAESNNYDEQYSAVLLRNTFVVALEEVEARGHHRIEDLTEDLRVIAERKPASPDLVRAVREHVAAAERVAAEAAQKFMTSAKKDKDGRVLDVGGGVWITTYDTTTDVTDALIQAQLAKSMAGQHYALELDIKVPDYALCVQQAAARAAAEYLSTALGQFFSTYSWVD